VSRATIADLANVTRTHSSIIPVDIYRIIRAHGIDIHCIKASSKFNGLYVRVEGVPVILLNARDAPTRRRFTAAHELYHHLSYTGGSTELRPLFYSVRERELSAPEIIEEKMANRFAAALLMPDCAVKDMVYKGFSPTRIARRFGVSVEAMDIRLQELGLCHLLSRQRSPFGS